MAEIFKVEVLRSDEDAVLVFNSFVETLTAMSREGEFSAPALGSVDLKNGKVFFETEVKASLAEAVAQTGEAIYHFLTGKSRKTNLSFSDILFGGYPNLFGWCGHFLGQTLHEMIYESKLPAKVELPAPHGALREPPAVADALAGKQRDSESDGGGDAGGGSSGSANSGNLILPNWQNQDELRTYWEELWKQFDIKLDPSPKKLIIPSITANHFTPHEPFLLIMPQGLKLNGLRDIMRSLFRCVFYKDDMDKHVPANDRTSKERSYALWVANSVEAPELLKNKSANMLKAEGIVAQVLAERLAQEVEHFKRTGQHLDIHNWTLCPGSRWSDGDVPFVGYFVSKVGVYWSHPDDHSGLLRARAAVLLP